MGDSQAENLAQAIKLTQKLRASVTKVFDNLSDGFHDTQGNEKALLNEFHQSLLTVNNDYNELEKVGNVLSPLSAQMPNSIHLSIDPARDKAPVYSQLLQAYKWSNKVCELAGIAANILDNSAGKMKRTQSIGITTAQAKKLRKTPPPTGHTAHPNVVDNFVARLDKTITVTRPLGSSCAILQINVGKILKAEVALRGLLIEWINVKGIHEETDPEDLKLSFWTKSKYEVFQKVTDSAMAASMHFFLPQNAEISLRSFLYWFQSYKTLFSAPCTKCGKHYLAGLPPIWRDVRNMEPYHDICKASTARV